MNRLLIVFAIALIPCSLLRADADNKDSKQQFMRLAAVLHAIPSGSDEGVTTWQQYSETDGTRASVDVDEWNLSRVVNLWSDKCRDHDLNNVVIISDSGRTVRFINYRMIANKGRRDVRVHRGDVVVFLRPEEHK